MRTKCKVFFPKTQQRLPSSGIKPRTINFSITSSILYQLSHRRSLFSCWLRISLVSSRQFAKVNKAIRIVTCSGWNDSAFPLFKKTNVLTIPLLFQNETAKLVHRHSSNDLPVNLSKYFTLPKNIYSTRSTTNENLQTPLLRRQRTQKSIKFTGAKIWNSIPSNIRKSSFRNIKKIFKAYLLHSSDYWLEKFCRFTHSQPIVWFIYLLLFTET